MLGFAELYRLVLTILQRDFKSNPFPKPCQSQVAIVSTQYLPLTQSKAYPQEHPIQHHHVLQAEDMRWDKGCLTIHPLTGPNSAGQQLLSTKNKREGKETSELVSPRNYGSCA